MDKKNYLSREEYGIWQYIKDKEIVDSEAIERIFPEISKSKKNKVLHNLHSKGYLKRARKDLYYNPLRIKDFYKLALRIKDGYLGLSSALRHYNLIEYEDFTIFVMTKNFQKDIAIEGTKYEIKFIPLKNLFAGFKKEGGTYISTLEKTFFDCFLKPRFVGFANITKALHNAKPDWKKFISFFKLANNSSLYQRTGYILELMKKNAKTNIPPFVFEFLLKRVKNPVKLMPIAGKSAFNRKWKIQDNLGKESILSWWY